MAHGGKMKANDTQIGGTHYTDKKVQPWDAMEAWMSREAFAGFLRGNCIKYLARCDDKGGIEDLKKARHYLDKLLEVMGEDIQAAFNAKTEYRKFENED
jgi:hypothetical protein